MSSFVETLSVTIQSLFYSYEIVAALQKNALRGLNFCLLPTKHRLPVVRFASWQKHLFIIALFRAFKSLFLGNAGYIMWGYVLYLQSKQCKNEKLYLLWLLVVNLGNIIQSCWVNRSDLVLYFHFNARTPHVMVTPWTHVCHANLMPQTRFHCNDCNVYDCVLHESGMQ